MYPLLFVAAILITGAVFPQLRGALTALLTFGIIVPIAMISGGSVLWGVLGLIYGPGVSWTDCVLYGGGGFALLLTANVYSRKP